MYCTNQVLQTSIARWQAANLPKENTIKHQVIVQTFEAHLKEIISNHWQEKHYEILSQRLRSAL